MPIKTNLSDIFSDLNSESSVILPKSIKIKNIKHIKNLDTISNTTSSFMPQKGGYSDATSSFMPQKGGNFIDSNKDINQLLSMLSATSDNNYTTNSTDTEQLKNKLFNILQEGGTPPRFSSRLISMIPASVRSRFGSPVRKPIDPPAPTTAAAATALATAPAPTAPTAPTAHTTPTALAPDHQQNFSIYSLNKDTKLSFILHTNDELRLQTYLQNKIVEFNKLDFSWITRLDNRLLNINKIISDILVPELTGANSNKELNLSFNIIADDQIEQIINLFHRFKSLNLEHTFLSNSIVEKIAIALKTNNTLETLNISDNIISIDNARKLGEALKKNTTLTKLDLGGTRLFNEGAHIILDSLTENTTLKSLDLSWNAIKDNTLKNKAALKSSIEFNFDNNFI